MDTVRFVFISDTHARQHEMSPLPKGDILVHTGDFSNVGDQYELQVFKEWFNSQSHPMKVLIAGNHECSLDTKYFVTEGYQRSRVASRMPEFEREAWSIENRRIISAPPSIYLEDSCCTANFNNNNENLCKELRFYGSPYQPEFCNWAFNLPWNDGSLERKWAQIPSNTDILLTHGPPRGILDWNLNKDPCGCPFLLNEIKTRIKPRIHAFGHLHDGYGTYFDGTTLFINASTCTEQYRATNRPIVVDLPLNRSLPPIIVLLEHQKF